METTKEVLKNESISTPISEQLSEFLKAYTSNKDWANTSIKTRVGTSTIRDVIYRYNALSENNSKAIVELVSIAKSNANRSIIKAKMAVDYFNKVLSNE
jgi:hypothetical protein